MKIRKRDDLPVLAAFLLVAVFSFLHPPTLSEPDAWGYSYAARAFGGFSLTIDEATFHSWVDEADRRGHPWQGDIGFAPVGEGRYGFIKSPGYALLLAPFARLGMARFLNLLLGFMVVLAGFKACARLLGKGPALTAAYLIIFSPGFLVMFHRPFMSDFASFACLTTGGALYLLHLCGTEGPRRSGPLLFFSGLALAAAVAVRYTNLTITALFALHFLYAFAAKKKNNAGPATLPHLLCFFLPMILIFALIGFYQAAVFGSPWRVGYGFIEHPRNEGVNFSHQYLAAGRIRDGFYSWVRNFAVIPGFLIPVLPATVFLFPGFYAYNILNGRHRRLLVLWLAAFWAVYAEYVILQASIYLIIGRMYLPVLLPTALFAAAFIHRFGSKARRACVAGLVILGVLFWFSFLAAEGTGPFSPPLSAYLENMKVIIWQGQSPPISDPG